MTKKFLIILIILFLLPAQFSLALIFNQETSPIENPASVPDPLAQYQIEDEAKGILQKAWEGLKEINDWGTGFWTKNFEPYLGKYAVQLEENIKQGWEEEKQEYRQDFFKALGAAWEKIKNFVLNR